MASAGAGSSSGQTEKGKKEIYTYEAPWTTYAMGWCRRPDGRFRMAVGSYKEEYSNQVQIIQLQRDEVGNGVFRHQCEFEHPYPATKVMWAPAKHHVGGASDLLATTGDYLRLWSMSTEGGGDAVNKVEMKALLNNNKHTEYCAPLTCFDWNDTDPSILGTCSIDTTCTIWDVNKLQPKTQLIAHDKEVYDIAFACGKDVFGTVGADGSLRMFDLRSLEHSTILYESPDLTPLLRIAWNKQDPNYLATILTDSPKAIILDIRVPSLPVAELVGHQAAVNGIAWAPHSPCHICTISDDRQALIWDITVKPKPIEDPILAFAAGGEVNQLQWCASHEDWVGICFNNCVQILKV
jgi:WD repeat-containing protein 68